MKLLNEKNRINIIFLLEYFSLTAKPTKINFMIFSSFLNIFLFFLSLLKYQCF